MSPKKVRRPLDIYVRVSRVAGREGDSFASPEVQEERCRALAHARGLAVGEVLTDLDQTGGKMSRPQLDLALERIEQGISGGLLVARLDRFSRTVAGALVTLERIDELGGVVLTAEGDFDTSTATGELVLGIMLQLAQFELRRIRESWFDVRKRAVARGVHISTRVPVGYRRNGDSRLEIDPKTAPHVHEVFVRRARGASWQACADYLNAEGVPTFKGGQWTPGNARVICTNRVYLGEARAGGTIVNPDAHRPIVTPAEWQAANRRKGERPAMRGEGQLLAGLVYCGTCGQRMVADTGYGGVRNYRCRNDRRSVAGCSHPTTIGAEKLEAHVTRFVLEHSTAEVLPERGNERHDAEVALAAAEEELNAYLTAVSAAGMGADAYAAGLRLREQARDEALDALSTFVVESPTEGRLLPADELPDAFAAWPVPTRRDFISAILAKVAVAPGRRPIEERVTFDERR